MAGEDGQGYQEDPQQRATQEVTASQEAVDASSKASYSLSSAQTSSAWGSEDGPEALGRKASEMFNGISDVLSKENALIAEFETKMRQAMTAIKEAEADNERSFQTVNHALEGVAGSEQAQALANTLEKTGFMEKQPAQNAGAAGAAQAPTGQPSGGGAPTTGGEHEGTQNAQVQGEQKAV